MAIYFRCTINQKINRLIISLTQHTVRLFEFEFPRQLIFGLHWSEILLKTGHKRTLFDLSKVVAFVLFMSASPVVTAYGISIPNDPINDSVIVRLQTSSIPRASSNSPSDTEITNWWVQAGSTGFGTGQNDYFNGAAMDAPIMTLMSGDQNQSLPGVKGGTNNALVTNLPMNGDKVFLSIWLKRQNQSWKRVLLSVITASSSTTPTKKVERNVYSIGLLYFGLYSWESTSMASHYEVWVNDSAGINVHDKWYRHNEVCLNAQAYYPDKCAMYFPSSPGAGTLWVRAWSVHGGFGPWSRAVTFDGSEKTSNSSQ